MDHDTLPPPGPGPDRGAPAPLSTRRRPWARFAGRRLGWGAALLGSMAAAATLSLHRPAPMLVQADVSGGADAGDAAQAPPPRSDPLWAAIDQWNRLRQSDRLPFESYAGFLLAHPNWPGEQANRRAAERQLATSAADPARVAAFLQAFPPLTGTGRVRLAEALAALGRTGEARDAAAVAWTGGALSPDDEGRLTARFAGQFTPDEQDRRMERLLWDRAAASATRQLAFVTPGRRALYAARLAFQTRAVDAAVQAAAAGPGAERDAGFVVDRAGWLRDTNQWLQARAYLAQARTFDAPPYDAQKYLEALLGFARAAASDNQDATVAGIAGQAPAAFAPGTDVSARALPERDPYTSLVWLGARAAMKAPGQGSRAEAAFRRYAAASATPGTKARGLYWAGRAAQAGGDPATAQADWAEASTYIDAFYGQLTADRLGHTLAIPPDPPAPDIAAEYRAQWMGREVVRAARLLGRQGEREDQTAFVRQIAADAKSDADHVLADELARSLGRPDLAVIVSRLPRSSGARDPLRLGFPTVLVPPAAGGDWTMIHAIARQESQFDRNALSPVGARGLMQLMPATAREQAGKLGLPFEAGRLTGDPQYNVLIGSAFWDRMLNYYGGNYVLAVASYNAGPGNVNRFLRTNGDPRSGAIDMIDWIEAIPLAETRTYVQKVLENAVVYDLLNPARARRPDRGRLSYYLGRPAGAVPATPGG